MQQINQLITCLENFETKECIKEIGKCHYHCCY